MTTVIKASQEISKEKLRLNKRWFGGLVVWIPIGSPYDERDCDWVGPEDPQNHQHPNHQLPSRSLTASFPLKNDGWKTILSCSEGNFSGAMLNFGRVIIS